MLKSSHRVRPLLDALAQAYDPRVTRPQELKLRSFAVLAKANWDQDTLKGHREGIQSTLGRWGAFTFDASINDVAQALKTAFLSRPHANLDEDLGELNTRIQANKPIDLAIRYEKETNFTGSPSFEDWAKRPENAYDTLVAKESDSFKFKEALQKPEVKKAFLERCKEFDEHMNFAARYEFLSKNACGEMRHYSPDDQAKFFEEFIPSPQGVSFFDWLNEKEYAVAKEALEEFTQRQGEVFQQVFKDETFKGLFIQNTKGRDFRQRQEPHFKMMQQFILRQTEALQVGTTTKAQIAEFLRKELSEEFQRSPWNPP